MKEKLNKPNFHHDMEKLFVQLIDQKRKSAEKTTKRKTSRREKSSETYLSWLEIYFDITSRKNEVLTKFINSNVIGKSIN